jgi:hypothetical protein
MTDDEIKKYVIETIMSGDRDRIIRVLHRYFKYLKKRKDKEIENIFGGKFESVDNPVEK